MTRQAKRQPARWDLRPWIYRQNIRMRNEWHRAKPGAIKKTIEEQIKNATRPDAVSEYLNKAFVADIEKFKTYKDKKTGFQNLDNEMGGLYAGLYVVGGISSVGKTTFIHQLGDQLAEQGDHIIYFSLEQVSLNW